MNPSLHELGFPAAAAASGTSRGRSSSPDKRGDAPADAAEQSLWRL